MKRSSIAVALLVFVAAFALASPASAAVCGDGICDAGEDSVNCALDCDCSVLNGPSEEYGLCCCCSNGPNPSGFCTPERYCASGIPVDNCQCCDNWYVDPFSLEIVCLDCIDGMLDPVPDWCAGLGAYDGSPKGTCGAAAAPTCTDTEISDEYLHDVNVRTRCTKIEAPMGRIEVGNLESVDFTLVFNEARPPPAELVHGWDQSTFKNTGPYGVGGWATTDGIFTDEGVYWSNVDAGGKPVTQGILKGTRGDRNNNGYVGYTLHTPYGDRTYDYPVVLKWNGEATAAYRAEPFDGKYLVVRPWIGTRMYMLFTYPNGPFEIYDFGLGTAYANNNIPDEVKYAALLSEVRRTFGPTKDQDPNGFEDKVIKIKRGAIQVAQQFGPPSSSNETAGITAQVDVVQGWSLDLDRQLQADGVSMLLTATRNPGKVKFYLYAMQTQSFRPTIHAHPGRLSNDTFVYNWVGGQLDAMTEITNDAMSKPTATTGVKYDRANNASTVDSEDVSESFLGVDRAKETIYLETCGLDGDPFPQGVTGTTVSLPGDLRNVYEFGDDSVQHRVVAMTDATGVRTQFQYNDQSTEPRGELSDAARVTSPVSPDMLSMGVGTHIDWSFELLAPFDAALFPNDTFVNLPGDSKGTPVPSKIERLPDGLVQRALSAFDVGVLAPRTIVDERGFTHSLTFYVDGALKSDESRGLRTEYRRSFRKSPTAVPPYPAGYVFLTIDRVLVGKNGDRLLDETWFDHAGRKISYIVAGQQLNPKDFSSGNANLKLEVEKLLVRGSFLTPGKMQTILNGTVTGETEVDWDTRYFGPQSAQAKSTSGVLASAAPNGAQGTVDGLGDASGSWTISGGATDVNMVQQFDPYGGVSKATLNGVGASVTFSAGPNGSLKASLSALSAAGAQAARDVTSYGSTTTKVCK